MIPNSNVDLLVLAERLIEAVSETEYEIRCNCIDGRNWFEVRDEFLTTLSDNKHYIIGRYNEN